MFDVLTIAAVADELNTSVLDGRVQRVGLVDPLTVALEIYANRQRWALIASCDGQRARVHLADTMPSLDSALITPFGLLLRKYVRGGVLVGIDQPPLERLIRLSIAKRLPPYNDRRRQAEHPDRELTDDGDVDAADDIDGDGEVEATYVHVAIEIMGRHSNLILIDDDGRVMESAKRVTPSMSRVRPILPRLPYTPPPPITKPDPRRMTSADATLMLDNEPPEAKLAQVLVRRLRAISPTMSREIAFRVAERHDVRVGDLDADAAARVARETRAILEPLLTAAWSPRVYEQDGTAVAFAPIPLSHLQADLEERRVESISAAAALVEVTDGEPATARHAQRRARLIQSIDQAVYRQRTRLRSLMTQQRRAEDAERLRARGELIYAYLWQVEPGATELRVDLEVIPLDPALSPKENAQHYFEQYRKAQGAGRHVPGLTSVVQSELAYLEQLRLMVEQADGFAALEALAAEWEGHGGSPALGRERAPRRRPTETRPRPLLDAGGNAVYIGRSGAQNDLVTFDIAGPDDTWLHARGVPGSHVVIKWRRSDAKDVQETIDAAAGLAAYYSTARGAGSVEVDVTRRRHVRKIKGSGPGLVTYRNERTIPVRPAEESSLSHVLAPVKAERQS